MIIAMLVMLVTSLLLVAVFTADNGDTRLSHIDLTQKQAYYAALAGVQEYEYKLEANPDYWETCPEPKGKVKGEESESYEVTTLAASSAPTTENTCSASSPPSNPFKTLIESKSALANTFRIKSIGTSGTSKRSLIATFQVAGFLNYIYFTQYEDADPNSYETNATQKKDCENYRPEREVLEAADHITCTNIYFGPEDTVNGPMKTDDKAQVCGGAEFGRVGHEPPDSIEINLGAVAYDCGAGTTATYNTATGKPTTGGPELVPPESDGSLSSYVESEDRLSGLTYLELEGEKNEINVVSKVMGNKKIKWPSNGLIYVQANGSCSYTEFEQSDTDTSKTLEEEKNCGSVYVKGTFSKSLTIAAENDLIINGNITPQGVTPGNAPSGTATVGLIATRYVRVYHPVEEGYEGKSPEFEGATHKEVIKIEPKSPKLGKELQVEVKEVGSKYEVIVYHEESGVLKELEKTLEYEKAEKLIGLSMANVVFREGANYSAGKSEKLKAGAGKWLDEKCNKNKQGKLEEFSSTKKLCEYTREHEECDAPNASSGLLTSPWIYAAILSTSHSFLVDNYNCGATLGDLNIDGAIGQKFRGVVGLINSSGYNKEYIYDERLATDEPPYFLAPLKAGWRIARETAPSPG